MKIKIVIAAFIMLVPSIFKTLNAQNVTVDFSLRDDSAKSMVGFLHGFNDYTETPPQPDSLIQTLKPRFWRTSAKVRIDKALHFGARPIIVLSDMWIGAYGTIRPYQDTLKFISFMDSVANEYMDSTHSYLYKHNVNGIDAWDTIYWDVWNEPDHDGWTVGQFLTVFRIVHNVLRAKNPNVFIEGPSTAHLSNTQTWIDTLLKYCKINNLKIDALSWHELDAGNTIPSIKDRLINMRKKYIKDSAYVKQIHINEIIGTWYHLNPGTFLASFYFLEQGRADGACKACWGSCYDNSVDGILVPDTGNQVPRAGWWAYKYYADGIIDGSRVVSSSTDESKIVALSSKKTIRNNEAQILIGSYSSAPTSSVTITMNHLNNLAFLQGKTYASISVARIPNSDTAMINSIPIERIELIQLSSSNIINISNIQLHEVIALTVKPSGPLPSIISSDTTIGSAIINTNVVINSGVTLTILPGSTIKVASGKSITSNGKILANGDSVSPITFTSITGTLANSWQYVLVQNGGSVFKYCMFQYANIGLYLNNADTGNQVLVENCTSQFNTNGIHSANSKVMIKGCDIKFNKYGVSAYNGSEMKYVGNRIRNNTYHGVYTYTDNSSYFYGNSIENNNICGIITSTRDIIQLGQVYGWVGKNTIRDNGQREIQANGSNPQITICGASIHDNDTYDEIYNYSTNPIIYAQSCYWGSEPQNPCYRVTSRVTPMATIYCSVPTFAQDGWDDGNVYISGSPIGKTSIPEIKDIIPCIIDPRISDREKIVLCKEIIAKDATSEEAITALGWLYFLVRTDYVENILGERETFFKYLQQVRSLARNSEAGKLALRYMIAWKGLENDLAYVIQLSKASIKELTGEERKLAVADLARTYTQRGQIIEARAMVQDLNQKHGEDLELINDIKRFITIAEQLVDQGIWKKVESESDEDIEIDIPTVYALQQNYPNPFNPVTSINYQIPKDGLVTLKIYDVLGREVITLIDEYKTVGYYSATFDASRLSSGLYIYRFVSQPADGGKNDAYTNVKKMLLIK